MNIRILIFLLATCAAWAQGSNLVVTTNGWFTAEEYAARHHELTRQGVHLAGNGAYARDWNNQLVVITCEHVLDALVAEHSGYHLSDDAVAYVPPGNPPPIPALPIARWNPDRPIAVRSYIPNQNRLVTVPAYHVEVSLIEEAIMAIGNLLFNGVADGYSRRHLAIVPKDPGVEPLIRGGCSGSPVIQDGCLVGVLNTSVEGTLRDSIEIVGLALFGAEQRSAELVYVTALLLAVAALYAIWRLLRRIFLCSRWAWRAFGPR